MATTVNQWRIYCETESVFVTGYLPEGSTCTVCFNNNTHLVNANSISIINTVSTSTTMISTQLSGITNGNFRAEKKKLICSAGSAEGVISSQSVSFPYNLNILAFSVQISPENVGDFIEIAITPISYIGVLESPITSGDTILTLTPFVFGFLSIGYQLVFTNNTNGFKEETSEILSVNTNNNSVTLTSGLVTSFPAGSYIKFQLKRLKTYYLGTTGSLVIGNYLRASFFPITVQSELRYTNFTNVTKNFYYGIEYLY